MKKYHLYLWLLALVGLITSCSQDETDALQTANESNRVTLTASLPEDFAQIGTRALPSADGHQLRCILEVWTQDPISPTLKQRIEQVGLTGDNVVFDFKIEEGTYDCLFWADFIATDAANENATNGDVTYTHYADKYYTTNNTDNGLRAVSLIESAYTGGFNTDARDAFFGHYELEKQAAAVKNPSIPALTRPFAKLTIKEKDATNYGYCSGLTATYEVPTTFNVLDGKVGSTTAQVTCNSKSTESQTLFSDYIFTDASSTLGSIDLTFTAAAADKELLPVTIPAGIPLKRNYKTNATGSLISEKPAPTNGVKLTVTMDAGWTGTEEEIIPAKVGDYFYADGTWGTAYINDASNPCIGIVFQTDPSRIGEAEKAALAAKGVTTPRGLVMALRNAAPGVIWSTENNDFSELTNCVTKEECNADINGLYNYTTVLTYATENSKLDAYPAFKAVTEFDVAVPAATTGWYMPSMGQLYDIFANLGGLPGWDSATERDNDYSWSEQTELASRLNYYFRQIQERYDAFLPTEDNALFFWSSSELSNDCARFWRVRSDGLVTCAWYYKNGSSAVRPVFAF